MAAMQGKQIHLKVPDKVGRLAEITDLLRQAKLNIIALCAWTQAGEGHLMMVTDEPDKACSVLKPHVQECRFDDVVCLTLPNIPGSLNEVAHKLADAGVAIDVVYATACDCQKCECDTATVVLKTTNNAKALEMLK